jgi:putative iron-dependent peroxidase
MPHHAQPGILQPVPAAARHLFFSIDWLHRDKPAEIRAALAALAAWADGDAAVVGLGPPLVRALGQTVPGLHDFPAQTVIAGSNGPPVPTTPNALWVWLRGDGRGDLALATIRLEHALAPAFTLDQIGESFRHGSGRDLTGYEDGTENPTGDAAIAAALVQGAGAGLDGASLAAVQLWQHEFINAFDDMTPAARDAAIGRRLSDNEELDDAPPSAHVKRTAQENFDPPAFMLRRSMPWVRDSMAGLMFVAFGHSLDAFEAQWRRMTGQDDGIADALFNFSFPLTSAYYWCPPMRAGRLDLSALGI